MAESTTQAESLGLRSRAASSTAPETPGCPALPNECPPGETTQSSSSPSPTPNLIREEPRIVRLLEQINNNQEQILRLLHERANPGHGISQVAQTIWHSRHNARTYKGGELAEFGEDTIGLAFLELFAPFGAPSAETATRNPSETDPSADGTGISLSQEATTGLEPNPIAARNRFRAWTGEAHFKSSDPATSLSNIDQWWPITWDNSWDDHVLYSSRALSYMFADSFDDAFRDEMVTSRTLEVLDLALYLYSKRKILTYFQAYQRATDEREAETAPRHSLVRTHFEPLRQC
jgi:hypothetical protein